MITTAAVTLLGVMGKKYLCGKEEQSTKFKTAFAVLLNIAASITIVITNKWLYTVVKFPNLMLTFLHFLSTFACLLVCQKLKLFKVKRVPIKSMIPLASCFCGFVVLTNLSLESNSVGTYQIAKVLTTPCIIVIQYQFYRRKTSLPTLLTVIPIIGGVVLNFMYDVKFNITGTVFALTGVIVTSLYQVLVGEKQRELQINSMQLLFYQAPISAAILVIPILLLEPVSDVIFRSWSFTEIGLLVSSCLIAFVVNLSIYWIIGNTSALTYNMAGHLKFCLTVAAGYMLFHEPLSFNQLMGLLLTLAGVVAYTHLRSA